MHDDISVAARLRFGISPTVQQGFAFNRSCFAFFPFLPTSPEIQGLLTHEAVPRLEAPNGRLFWFRRIRSTSELSRQLFHPQVLRLIFLVTE